jgi:hypothetical protein
MTEVSSRRQEAWSVSESLSISPRTEAEFVAFDTATERSWIIGRDVADLLLLLRGGWQPSESLPLGSSEAMRRLRPEEMTSLLAALRERGLANGPFAAHSDGSIFLARM